MKCLHAVVHGDVQGISYRQFVKESAENLGLTGSVRNLPDGTVDVVAEGDETTLQEFLQKLKQGHPSARVTQIDEIRSKASGEFIGFFIR